MCAQKGLSNEDSKKILDKVNQLSNQGMFRSAMDLIFEILDEIPDEELALKMANLLLYTNQSRSQAYAASEPLTTRYLLDTRLDHLFCECANCNSTWTINPMAEFYGSTTVINPVGGYCPRCKNVFCRNCYKKKFWSKKVGAGSIGYCPSCNVQMEPIKNPNGRRPRQAARKSKPMKLFIFLREGPVPPPPEYLTKMIRLVSPEVLNDNPKLIVQPVPNWSGNQQELSSLMYAIVAREGYSMDDMQTFFFSPDENGSHFCIAKVY